MPPDCEINWKEHRPSIKGGHNFGMILDSTFEHHTVNMRHLLIVATCLAAARALPAEKLKREILPGDPRYGTEHHQHVNEVVVNPSVNGYADSYTVPEAKLELPHDAYGPPAFVPGVPLNGVSFSPLVDVTKFSTPLPSYGVPDTVHVPETASVIQDLKNTVSTTTVTIPAAKVQTVVSPPATSYGTPVVDAKVPLHTEDEAHIASVQKTVRTEVVDLPKPVVKVAQHAPVAQGFTKVTHVKTVPAAKTTITSQKNVVDGALFTEGFPEFRTTGFLNTPTFDFASHVPSTLYTNVQPSFNTGFHTGYQYNAQHLHPAPLSVPLTKSIPTTHPLAHTAHTVQLPKTSFELPHSLAHTVEHAEPVHSVKSFEHFTPVYPVTSLTSVKSFETISPVHTVQTVGALPSVHPVTSVKSFDTLHPVHTVKTFESLPPVHPVTSIKSYGTSHPVHTVNTFESLPAVHPVTSVKSYDTSYPVHTVKTLESLPTVHPVTTVKSYDTLHPVHTVKTFESLPPVHPVTSIKSYGTSHPVHTVKTLESLPPVHPVTSIKSYGTSHPVHTVKTLKSLPTVRPVTSVKSYDTLHPVHTVKTFESLPPVHSLTSAQSYGFLHPVHAVKTFESFPAVHSVETVTPVHTVKTLESVTPVPSVHSVDILPPVEPVHTLTEVKTKAVVEDSAGQAAKGSLQDLFSDFLQNVPQLPQIPSFPTFTLPTQSPAPAVNVHVAGTTVDKDTVSIENPVLAVDAAVHVTPSNEYVQPTDANGGYVY